MLVDERLRTASFVFHDVLNSLTHEVEIVSALPCQSFAELSKLLLRFLRATDSDISRGGGGDGEHVFKLSEDYSIDTDFTPPIAASSSSIDLKYLFKSFSNRLSFTRSGSFK